MISDTSQFAPGQPAITYGLRGIAYYELGLTGPNQDLHSGTFGGAVANPANALCAMLAALDQRRGQVQIPGFYDDVEPLSARAGRVQQAAVRRARFHATVGVDALRGEEGYSTLERRWARPTFDINGLLSGYQGEGAKTVLPARADGQSSAFAWCRSRIRRRSPRPWNSDCENCAPRGIQMELIDFHGAPGVVVPLDSPYVAAAERAIEPDSAAAGLHARRGLDPGRGDLSRIAGSRYVAVGLGPGRRQHAQPQRKVLPGRLPPRHQGQRSFVARAGTDESHLMRIALVPGFHHVNESSHCVY